MAAETTTIPEFVDMATMAEWLGWKQKNTSMFFARHGYATKLGGKLYVSRSTLRDKLPEVYSALVDKLTGQSAVAALDDL